MHLWPDMQLTLTLNNLPMRSAKKYWFCGKEKSTTRSKKGFPNQIYSLLLAYLNDSNAAAHSVESDTFQRGDSSICALQYLTLKNLYFLKHCQIVGNLSLYASISCMMTHRWRVVTRDRDKKTHYKSELWFTSTSLLPDHEDRKMGRVRVHCDV